MERLLNPAKYIRKYEDLARLAERLRNEPLVAVDTESNSLYAYRERVCLIQISTRTEDYIIDPLIIADMQPLGPLLADPAVEKVFHAAEYDLICLRRDYGFVVNNLFDTMVAARVCGHKQVGLGSLLSEFLDVEIDKSHQRDDWGQRPLPPDSLLYAQMDTHYLPVLRDRLADELTRLDRWGEAQEAFHEATQVTTPDTSFDPEGYWRIGLPNQLTRRQMAILRELYLLREQIAEKRDLPPFKIFTDKTLVQLATIAPQTNGDLRGVPGMTAAQVRRYGRALLRAIERGSKARLPDPPERSPAADPEIVDCYTMLREWRKNRAQERGVESDVIISREALWTLAHRQPETLDDMRDIQGLGPWRLETYGPELLDIVRRCRQRVK
ncbi:MAG: HRDC domain-containing protein [Chloroflexota bacterium]|nr:MAG: ribonuclease D [Chloroflexota bacterium]